jgi:hypothetical protein
MLSVFRRRNNTASHAVMITVLHNIHVARCLQQSNIAPPEIDAHVNCIILVIVLNVEKKTDSKHFSFSYKQVYVYNSIVRV